MKFYILPLTLTGKEGHTLIIQIEKILESFNNPVGSIHITE